MMDKVRLRGLLVAVPALALLVACQPVSGDPNDITPPTISFWVGNRSVAGGVTLASLPPGGVRVVATDPGGMTSLDVTNIAVFDCLALGRREVQSAQLIDIPATQYDVAQHVYHGPNGDFWPDADGDGVNEPAEFGLRYDQLMQDVDLEYLQSINGIEGAACTMSDGSAGTSAVRYVLIEAFATNFRASILASDATEAYAETVVFVS
jgi:hypothetical protein